MSFATVYRATQDPPVQTLCWQHYPREKQEAIRKGLDRIPVSETVPKKKQETAADPTETKSTSDIPCSCLGCAQMYRCNGMDTPSPPPHPAQDGPKTTSSDPEAKAKQPVPASTVTQTTDVKTAQAMGSVQPVALSTTSKTVEYYAVSAATERYSREELDLLMEDIASHPDQYEAVDRDKTDERFGTQTLDMMRRWERVMSSTCRTPMVWSVFERYPSIDHLFLLPLPIERKTIEHDPQTGTARTTYSVLYRSRGKTLYQYHKKEGALLSIRQLVTLFDLCLALHMLGVVHTNWKDEDVFIDKYGRCIRLAEFSDSTLLSDRYVETQYLCNEPVQDTLHAPSMATNPPAPIPPLNVADRSRTWDIRDRYRIERDINKERNDLLDFYYLIERVVKGAIDPVQVNAFKLSWAVLDSHVRGVDLKGLPSIDGIYMARNYLVDLLRTSTELSPVIDGKDKDSEVEAEDSTDEESEDEEEEEDNDTSKTSRSLEANEQKHPSTARNCDQAETDDPSDDDDEDRSKDESSDEDSEDEAKELRRRQIRALLQPSTFQRLW